MPTKILPGRPHPLGATWDGAGTNFAIFSEHAEWVELCLFDKPDAAECERIRLPERTTYVWHGYIHGLRPERSGRACSVISGGLPRAEAAERFAFAGGGAAVTTLARHFPVGAEVFEDDVHFRVWAPVRKTVEVVFDSGATVPLKREEAGYFSGWARNVRAGSCYKYRLDGGELCPDPASRFQPEGPHGSSEIVDASAFMDRSQTAHSSRPAIAFLRITRITSPGTMAIFARETRPIIKARCGRG